MEQKRKKIIVNNRLKREKNAQKYKKFVGNKDEGQGFADKRKKNIMHQYHKVLKKEKQEMVKYGGKVGEIYQQEEQQDLAPRQKLFRRINPKKVSAYSKAQEEWNRKAKEKEEKQQEFLKRQEQQEEALTKYKQKKKDNHRKLAKKNYKGQPNMASQMEVLLQRIQGQSKNPKTS